MIKKLLIANRGEIALRIIRACKEIGIESVAVFSEADRNSLHVRFADEAVCIGLAPSKSSYLNIPTLVSACQITNSDAVHPGYGFLAENDFFAEILNDCGLTFVGPSSHAIRTMGNKSLAKETMIKAGVPVIPGSNGIVHSLDKALETAHETGYPVLLKAVAGGGGKGMRIVESDEEMYRFYPLTRNEAEKAFSNPDLYIEKLIRSARHVEIQVMGDSHGNIIHLNERDCSIQRRHQKLIEEAPSPIISEDLRQKMGQAAVQAAHAVNYVGPWTVEFLVDENINFYFMEMNTRIQVEHPVTEETLGVDLIAEQILVAGGEQLSIKNTPPRKHAIECRINAENPEQGFRPSPGRITSLHFPGGNGIRVDSHVYEGYEIPPYYDSLIAKLIASGRTRTEAIHKMKRALEEFIIEGIHTTIPFHLKMMENEDFINNNYDTKYLENHDWNA